jgi:hypothetical protein
MTDVNRSYSWEDEDVYWRNNYRNRPYGSGDYSAYQPGYRYGSESAQRYQGRQWSEVESDLARDWEGYEHRGSSTWQQVKDAVRDAWDRVTGSGPSGRATERY